MVSYSDPEDCGWRTDDAMTTFPSSSSLVMDAGSVELTLTGECGLDRASGLPETYYGMAGIIDY